MKTIATDPILVTFRTSADEPPVNGAFWREFGRIRGEIIGDGEGGLYLIFKKRILKQRYLTPFFYLILNLKVNVNRSFWGGCKNIAQGRTLS